MLNSEERAERESLLAIIAALLEDRMYDHDLRKLLANVAIDRHMSLHANSPLGSGETKELGDKLQQVQSFIACMNSFCVNVNTHLREFKRPEFTTNMMVLQSVQAKYQLNFIEGEGKIQISIIERSKLPNSSKIITPGSEAAQ